MRFNESSSIILHRNGLNDHLLLVVKHTMIQRIGNRVPRVYVMAALVTHAAQVVKERHATIGMTLAQSNCSRFT